MTARKPRVVVFTTLFPHSGQPLAGLFIRERMFRLRDALPITVICPVPWFPLQGLIRRWKPHFRPSAPRFEVQDGVEVRCPRFFSVPGLFKWLDGFFMALGALPDTLRVRRSSGVDVIDAHFAYPDGYAASLLGRWLGVPVTITLRGTEVPIAAEPRKRVRMLSALQAARRIFAVSESLRRHAIGLGVPAEKVRVIGNGVDTAKFHPVSRAQARERLDLAPGAAVLVSVGALVERKGFHRVMEVMPELRRRFPDLHYLIVGGASPEGDWGALLRSRAEELGLRDRVHFLGALRPEELKFVLSAADVFVLATRNEGWANVLLEAMACGLPVVATDVGGNAQVISRPDVGLLVPFGHRLALTEAIAQALQRPWDRSAILAYAAANGWDRRVEALTEEFVAIAAQGRSACTGVQPMESA